MAENWTAVASEVTSALASVGYSVTHRRVTNGVGANAWTPGAPVTTDTPVIILSDSYSSFEIDGTLVLASDRKLLMNAQAVVPVPGDLFVIGSQVLRVITVKPLDPGGVALMYEIQARL